MWAVLCQSTPKNFEKFRRELLHFLFLMGCCVDLTPKHPQQNSQISLQEDHPQSRKSVGIA